MHAPLLKLPEKNGETGRLKERLTPQDRDPVSGFASRVEKGFHDLRYGEENAATRVMGLGNVTASYLQ